MAGCGGGTPLAVVCPGFLASGPRSLGPLCERPRVPLPGTPPGVARVLAWGLRVAGSPGQGIVRGAVAGWAAGPRGVRAAGALVLAGLGLPSLSSEHLPSPGGRAPLRLGGPGLPVTGGVALEAASVAEQSPSPGAGVALAPPAGSLRDGRAPSLSKWSLSWTAGSGGAGPDRRQDRVAAGAVYCIRIAAG